MNVTFNNRKGKYIQRGEIINNMGEAGKAS